MKAREIMTPDPASCLPDETVEEAARRMVERDCGCLPVLADREGGKLMALVTDRDLAARVLARGLGPGTRVSEAMSVAPSCCHPDSSIEEVKEIMAERQVRRVPVIDAQGRCVGIISQADLARAADSLVTADLAERISEPTSDPRAETDVGLHPRV